MKENPRRLNTELLGCDTIFKKNYIMPIFSQKVDRLANVLWVRQKT